MDRDSKKRVGMPKDKALNIAISVIGKFQQNNDMMVYIVVFDKEAVTRRSIILRKILEKELECFKFVWSDQKTLDPDFCA